VLLVLFPKHRDERARAVAAYAGVDVRTGPFLDRHIDGDILTVSAGYRFQATRGDD
jgi:hypothetical protein